jgi:acylphosphatase
MTARILVFGFVQGVGFRQAVKRKAKLLGLTGWVKNLPDNRVEALFSGPKEKIEEIILYCKKGPFLSEVKHVDVGWEAEEDFIEFTIIK